MLHDKELGYYLCNGIEFHSKIEAVIYSQKMSKPIKWVFHDDIFSKYPWHIEPTESLDELYDRRARELREKYDYIIISYSGGSDSHNLLQSFIRQNLHVDEIVTSHLTKLTEAYTTLDPTMKRPSNFAAEHVLQAIPRLKEIEILLPKTKITVLEMSDVVLATINNSNDGDWVEHRRDALGIAQQLRGNYTYLAEFKKNYDKNKSIGLIIGAEKPRTYINRSNEFVFFVNDAAVNITGINDYNEYPNVRVELFYWGSTTAPMMCKQAHVIKRWVQADPELMRLWKDFIPEVFRGVHEKMLRNIIYTTWHDEWFQVNKPTRAWTNELDDWFHKGMKHTRQYELWKKGVDYVATQAPDYVIYKNGVPDTMAPFSQQYVIGKIEIK